MKKSKTKSKNAKRYQKSSKNALKRTKNENSMLKKVVAALSQYVIEVYGQNENFKQKNKKLRILTTPQEKFTEDEKVILRNVPEKFKWLARDEDGDLYVYTNKPKKYIPTWRLSGFHEDDEYSSMKAFNHLFQCIKWNDDEPCEFRRFL